VKRFLLLLLVAVAAAGVYAWLEQRAAEEERAKPGLFVEVEVVDGAGHAVTRADVQARYAPGWRPVDANGHIGLDGVVLRAEDAVTVAAVAGAIDVRSPTHASRRGREPEVERRADGTWHARFVLDAYGTVRLRIADTTLEGVKAWVVADPKAGRIEAPRGVAVARPGQPAEWRVFEGVEKVEVRIEGATGVAARSLVLAAPTEGYVRELALEAEPAQPIRGRVLPPAGDGEAPPTLRGHADVVELTDDGREVAFPRVRVEDDGSFVVPYAGEGRYKVTPVLQFARVPPKRVRGGEEVEVEGAVANPWLVLEGLEVEEDAPPPAANVTRIDEAGETHVSVWAFFDAKRGWMLSLPGPGRYRVALTRRGTNDAPPAAGLAEVDVEGSGPHAVAFELAPVPSGTLEIRVVAAESDGGADVEVEADGTRHATVLLALGDVARVPNVRAGPFTALVRFTAKQAAVRFLAGEVVAGETTQVEAQAVPGGTLIGRGRGARLGEDTRDRRIAWKAGGSPYGDAPGEVTLVREAGKDRWTCPWPLAPGRYAATIAPWPREGPGESASLVFEIRAGEATEIPFEVR